MDKVKFHFDPRCPWCYQTSRWIRRLEELGEVETDWGIFSLEVVNLEAGKDPRQIDAVSGPALRTAIVIRDNFGSKAIGPFYAALGKRIWETVPPAEDQVAAVRESLEEAGLDPSLVDKAMADESTWDAVLAEHNELIANTRSFGVPTIVLDGGEGLAIFGPVISELPTDDDGVELWKHVSWLARYENFSELKRDRTIKNDLPAAVWRAKQRELQAQADAKA
jgi:protein-disulfide isomerase-like protein with CxxC motif